MINKLTHLTGNRKVLSGEAIGVSNANAHAAAEARFHNGAMTSNKAQFNSSYIILYIWVINSIYRNTIRAKAIAGILNLGIT